MGMGEHQKRGKGEVIWLTPPDLIDALGPFDLDPCFSSPRPWDTAAEHYGPDAADGLGGLFAPWHGFVWCNPPYDDHSAEWLGKCHEHGNALALIFARTETDTFRDWVWRRADAVFFLYGRLTFRTPWGAYAKHNGGAPSALICYGSTAVQRVKDAALNGVLIDLNLVRAE